MDDTPTKQEPEAKRPSNVRERSRPRPKRGPTPRTASPTRTIEPGVVHHRIAKGILTGIQERANDMGIPLDVGTFPAMATVATDETDDPERLANITAHAVARIADRFTFLRKFSRHMEGTEKRAGILSDLTGAMFTLYKRNPDVLETLAGQLRNEMMARRAAAKAGKAAPPNGQPQPNVGGPIHAAR